MNLNSDELSVLRRLAKGRTSSVDRQIADNLQELGLVGRVAGISMVYRITPEGADALTDAEVYAIPCSELPDHLEVLTCLVGRHGAAILRRAAEHIKDAETLLELNQIALTRAAKIETALTSLNTAIDDMWNTGPTSDPEVHRLAITRAQQALRAALEGT